MAEDYYNKDGVHDPFADRKAPPAKRKRSKVKTPLVALAAVLWLVAFAAGAKLDSVTKSTPEKRIIAAVTEVAMEGASCSGAPDLEVRTVPPTFEIEQTITTLRAEGFVHVAGTILEIPGPNGPLRVAVLFGLYCPMT